MTKKKNDAAIATERAHVEAPITARNKSAHPKRAGVSVQRGGRSRRKASLANIIQGEVSFFNGWAISKEGERDACEKAAEKILARIERWKRPTGYYGENVSFSEVSK